MTPTVLTPEQIELGKQMDEWAKRPVDPTKAAMSAVIVHALVDDLIERADATESSESIERGESAA